MKLVSVIIPTYNQADYLPICLDSLWFQEYENLEIIVVDDGSDNDTEEAVRKFQCEVATASASFAGFYDEAKNEVLRIYHPRYPQHGRYFKLIRHETNMGLGHVLNTGFTAATGDYVTYIASDDLYLPHAVSTMVKALEEKDADFVYSDMHIVDDTGRILRRFSLPDYSFEESFLNWYLCGISKLYRRELHDRFGYYDPKLLAHDHECFLRFAMGGAKFAHIPQVLACVRFHGPEREVYNHAPEQKMRLFDESKRLVLEARSFNRKKQG